MTLLGAAVLILAGVQDGKVQLRWKFAEGMSLRYRMSQAILLKGARETLRQDTSTFVRWDVTRIDSSGHAAITFTYEAITFSKESAHGKIAFDSRTDDGTPPQEARVQALLVGKSLGLKVTPEGRILDVTGVDRLVDALVAGEPDPVASRRALAKSFSAEALRSMMQQMAPTLPSTKVARQERWKDTYTLEMPMVGAAQFTAISELTGVEGGTAAFDQEVMVEFKPDRPAGSVRVAGIRGKANNRFSMDRGVFLSSTSVLNVTLQSGETMLPMKVTGEFRLLD